MVRHLAVCVSAHGYGHIGQTAPVLDALRERVSKLKVTVRSAAPAFKLFERFGTGIQHAAVDLDVGMIQRNALEVDTDATAETYRRFHERWPERVSAEADALRQLQPDLVLANVPYLSLAAAQQAQISAVALSSICWSDIYRHYYAGKRPEARRILSQMLESYNSVERFLQPVPSMPMDGVVKGQSIGPIAQLGKARRTELLEALGASETDRLVMISLGGMDARIPLDNWDELTGLRFVVPQGWGTMHPRATPLEKLGMPFIDVLASCDALVAKPGYGSFVEAACLGKPVLYLDRPDWPEVVFLVEWLRHKGRCARISVEDFSNGMFRAKLDALCASPQSPARPHGIDEAADYLAALLR